MKTSQRFRICRSKPIRLPQLSGTDDSPEYLIGLSVRGVENARIEELREVAYSVGSGDGFAGREDNCFLRHIKLRGEGPHQITVTIRDQQGGVIERRLDVDTTGALAESISYVEYTREGAVEAETKSSKFEVAFSFAGKHREFIELIVTKIESVIPRPTIFIDKDRLDLVSGSNKDRTLMDVFRSAELMVAFLSAEYRQSEWCNVEFRVVKEAIKAGADKKVLMFRLQKKFVPKEYGLTSLDCAPFIHRTNAGAGEVARAILERFKQLGDAR